MRLSLYVSFTGAMLSTLVTCHILKEALNLRSLVKAYQNHEIELGSMIVKLDEVLLKIDPALQLSNFPDTNDRVRLQDLKWKLWGLKDDTQALGIIYESTDAIWGIADGRPIDAYKILEASEVNDKTSGLSDQPILKALELRFWVEAYIAGWTKTSGGVEYLPYLLKPIYLSEAGTSDTAQHDETSNIIVECSNLILNNSGLYQNGPDSQRIPYQSLAIFLEWYDGNYDHAREMLKKSISEDNDLEFTEELNNQSRSTVRE